MTWYPYGRDTAHARPGPEMLDLWHLDLFYLTFILPGERFKIEFSFTKVSCVIKQHNKSKVSTDKHFSNI